MTIDWSGWMMATPEEQKEMWRRYREIVKRESDHSRATNYAAMDAAIRAAAQKVS